MGEDNSVISICMERRSLVPIKILTNMFVAKIQPPYTVCVYLVAKSCLTLVNPRIVAHKAPLSMGFSRQEYWSGLPFSPPRDLPNPGIGPESPVFPTLQLDSLPAEPSEKPSVHWC